MKYRIKNETLNNLTVVKYENNTLGKQKRIRLHMSNMFPHKLVLTYIKEPQ